MYELRKNLISLGVLDFTSYKCTTQDGVMKVSKGILVVMEENMIVIFYQLEGRTEISQEVVAFDGGSDSTHLRHQHLGHMSEKGIKVLVDIKIIIC